MTVPMWVIIWLQVYAWVEVLDRCLVLVPGWLDLPMSPTRFMLSTLLSTLGIEFLTNEPVLRLARGLQVLPPPEKSAGATPRRKKTSRARSSSPATRYPTHVPTAGRPPPGAIAAPAVFAAAVSATAAATVCNLPSAVLADATQLLSAGVAGGIGGALLLIAFNNITDYHTNFAMVEHVLAMDAMIPALGDITVKWRAVTSTTLHHLAYAAIIATETTIGTLCTVGAYRQATASDDKAKVVALDMTLVGLGLGFLLFFVGFVMVGAEWWYMWGSENFNGQIKAFHWSTVIILAILLHIPQRAALS